MVCFFVARKNKLPRPKPRLIENKNCKSNKVIKLVHIIMVCFPSLKQAPGFWVFSTNEKAAGKNGVL